MSKKITEKDIQIAYELKKLKALENRVKVAKQLIEIENENGEPFFDADYVKRVILNL